MSSDLLQGEVLVGFTVSLANIAIHAVMMAVLVWAAHRTSHVTRDVHARVRLVIVMWATVTVLMYAHLCEVVVWGLTYDLLAAVPHGEERSTLHSSTIRRSAMATSSPQRAGGCSAR